MSLAPYLFIHCFYLSRHYLSKINTYVCISLRGLETLFDQCTRYAQHWTVKIKRETTTVIKLLITSTCGGRVVSGVGETCAARRRRNASSVESNPPDSFKYQPHLSLIIIIIFQQVFLASVFSPLAFYTTGQKNNNIIHTFVYCCKVITSEAVYSPAFTGTKLYCLVTEAHRCK